jgi:small subunit ribosomal protein S1
MPEGRLINTDENRLSLNSPEALEKAREAGTILEGKAVMCDAQRNLQVDLNGIRGVIPRSETVMGIDEGSTREIAILSRVGKPVCFKVKSGVLRDENGPYVQLSRREAQEQALEFFLSTLRSGDVIEGRVTHIEPFGVFVDIGCGVISFISIENISVSRISHPLDRFLPGQELYAAVLSVDKELRRVTLTHKELLGTWLENASQFTAGETVTGIVRGVEDYGVFIELTPNLSGLAEKRDRIAEGQCVSAYIKSLLPGRMKLKLAIIDILDTGKAKPLKYFIRSGHIGRWEYSPENCAGKKIVTVFEP